MSIRPLHARLMITDAAFDYAANLVDLSRAAESMEEWAKADAALPNLPKADRAVKSAYPARALLVALALLVHTRQPVSWASMLQLFWCQLSDDHLVELGLRDSMDQERLTTFRTLARQATGDWPPDAVKQLRSEYSRLVRSLDRAFGCLRFSPHDRRGKKTNLELKQVVARLSDDQRNHLAAKVNRHAILMNDIVAASVDRDLVRRHRGDIMFDEVVIQVAKTGNTGTKDHKRHTGNPDAVWFTKGDKDTPRWAHGATFIMSSQRPSEERLPAQVVGMSIGPATGGSVEPTTSAIDQAIRTGLLSNRTGAARNRFAIADMGFTQKRGMNRALVDRGYYLIQDHPVGRALRKSLPEGPVMFNDVIICPGFAPSTNRPFPRLDRAATGQMRAEHSQREAHLLAGRMLPNGRPQLAVQRGRGRPRKDAEAINAMRIEVSCPAAADQCRCPHVPTSLALPSTVPDVPAPPPQHDMPAVCGRTYSAILLDDKAFKDYGVHLFGGTEHEALYSSARNANEQWHSLLRAEHTGGMDLTFFNTLGIERIGVILAFAVAVTNDAVARSFSQKHGQAALAA